MKGADAFHFEPHAGRSVSKMMKRFILGAVTTAGLAFVPYSALSAIWVWGFGKYTPKFGPFGTWTLATQIAGIVTIAALIGFALSFPLLHRLTRAQRTWRYLATIAVPVVMIYILMPVGFVGWLLDLIDPGSFIGCVPVGILAYLPGLLGAIGITMIGKSQNQLLHRIAKGRASLAFVKR